MSTRTRWFHANYSTSDRPARLDRMYRQVNSLLCDLLVDGKTFHRGIKVSQHHRFI